jgi:hypothetical protein
MTILLGTAVGPAGAQSGQAAPEAVGPKLSTRVKAVIRTELPRYAPQLPVEVEPAEIFTTAEMKDSTLHLPKMTVRDAMKAPVTSTDWLSPRGRMEFALKRFPGTRLGNFFGLNNPWAWARLTEDIEAERHAALKERGLSVLIADTPEDRENRKLLKAALMYSGRAAAK